METKRIVLIDAACAAFQLAAIADSQDEPWEALAKLIPCYDANGGLIAREGEIISVIWCFDCKAEFDFGRGYWRHQELRNIGIQYKPGRPENPGIDKIKMAIANRIPLERQARQRGFEADDIIANLVQQYAYFNIDIITVDTDLMQLINSRVRWVNTARYEPIIRGIEEAKAYCLKKWRTVISDPREIVRIKSTKGDLSDGLPKGIDEKFIDLVNPMIKCPYRHMAPLTWWKPPGNTLGFYYDCASAPILKDNRERVTLFG